MTMQRWHIFLISALTITTAVFWYSHTFKPVRESITYFPIDPHITFRNAGTEIIPEKGKQILLRSYSAMDTPAFLRHDITMLFASGKLVAKMGKWEQGVLFLEQSQIFTLQENTKLQAISFHHAEIHENSSITSTHELTEDLFYFIVSEHEDTASFKTPDTATDLLWQEFLDKQESRFITTSIDTIAATYSLDRQHFDIFPLTVLSTYEQEPLPSFSRAETKIIIGQLIEGLYKNYFLGIKKEDGTTVSPINSTVPIIFLAKNREFLYVSFITADGEVILLKQNISV